MIFRLNGSRPAVACAADLLDRGDRLWCQGPSVYVDRRDDALAHIRRIKAQGGISIKNYNQPRREQRQQVVAAARAEDMLVVAEGGSLFGIRI